jgi:diaminopimelate epimerase
MTIHFEKYQGTGNDFILIDGRHLPTLPNTNTIAQWCHRKFGVGADGCMFLLNEPGYDFRMVYFNADGRESTMCGNGGRCIAAFAHQLGIGIEGVLHFIAIDGPHDAVVMPNQFVTLSMIDVHDIQLPNDQHFSLNTGSPHYVVFCDQIQNLDILPSARHIRYNETYATEGINVNFAEIINEKEITVRTYERGVEDETLSCGTGVTACAMAYSRYVRLNDGMHTIRIHTSGGDLWVSFSISNGIWKDVSLKGPAIPVFSGTIAFS